MGVGHIAGNMGMEGVFAGNYGINVQVIDILIFSYFTILPFKMCFLKETAAIICFPAQFAGFESQRLDLSRDFPDFAGIAR